MQSSFDQISYPVSQQTSMTQVLPEYIPEEEKHLRDYWRIISKRRWTTITVFLIIFITATIITLRQIPVYQATTKLQIDSENPNVIKIEEVMNLSPSDRDYNQTQFKLLQSRSLAVAVIKKLELDKSPEFVSLQEKGHLGILDSLTPLRLLSSILSLLKNKKHLDSFITPEEEEIAQMSKLVNSFLNRIKVEPERNTRLVNVSFSGKYPKIITEVTNTLARLFIEHNQQLKFAASTEAIEWLDKHLAQLKKKVEESEAELHRYKEKNNIVSLEEKQNIIVQRLSDLNAAVTNAKTERIKLETLYNQIKKYADKDAVIESLPAVIRNSLIQDLKTKYITLQAEYNQISQKFGKKHPYIIEISSKMEVIYEKIQSEVNKIINSIKTEYDIALAEESVLREALEEQKKEAMDLNQKAILYGVLKREAESNKQVFNVVLDRLKETDLTRGLKLSNIRIIDRAEVPIHPIKPNKRLNILLSAIAGLMAGIGLALFFEYLDDTVKTPEDLKRYLNLTFLGPIPHFDFNQNKMQKYPELVTFNDPKSQISEAYKGLRTSILFSIPGEGGKSILITSAGTGEGKSITLANLAITLAQAGNRVCIVDCDMRKPRIHKLFNLSNEIGTSSLLIGQATVEEIMQDSFFPGLKIIPCGHRPPNPSELLGSCQMKDLIQSLKKSYDYILIDSPPIVAVTDSVLLSRLVDGACIVIKGGDTSKEIIKRSVDLLRNVRAHILGAAINDIDIAKKSYYYHYYYSYYGDDGDGHKKDKKDKKQEYDTKMIKKV